MGNSIKKFVFETCLPFFAKPICILVLLLQMAILDYFLIVHTSRDIKLRAMGPDENYGNATVTPPEIPANWPWYLWVIPDIAIVALFIAAFVVSHRHFKLTPSQQTANVGIGGELPLGYITWLAYSLLTATKVGLIFRWTAQTLDTEGWIGINLLKFGISLTAVVFLMFVSSHSSAKRDLQRDAFITLIQHSITMDLLDTTDMLHVILYKESHVTLTFGFHKAIIAIGCINLILPTILLVALSKSRFGESVVWQKRLVVIHKIIYQILVNVPLLIVRAFLTHVYKQNVSVFAVKNAIALGIVFRTTSIKVEEAVTAREEEAHPESTEMRALTSNPTDFESPTASVDVPVADLTPATNEEGGGARRGTAFV